MIVVEKQFAEYGSTAKSKSILDCLIMKIKRLGLRFLYQMIFTIFPHNLLIELILLKNRNKITGHNTQYGKKR